MLLPALAAAPLAAQSKDELYKQAVGAATSGKVADAQRLYCQLAQQDPAFKDVKMMCTVMTSELNKEIKRSEDRFNEGVAAVNKGDFEEAEQKFRNVKAGPKVAEAQQYLGRIPQLKKEREGQAAEAAVNAKFDQAVQAYNGNNFSQAKSLLGQMGGSKRASEAQTYLNKINQYEQAMREGDTLAKAGNFRGAINAYTEATNVKGDGPGDPRGKINQMNSEMARMGEEEKKKQEQLAAEAKRAEEERRRKEREQQIAGLMNEANAARQRGDYGTAKAKLNQVLGMDGGNGEARAALDDVVKTEKRAAAAAAAIKEPAQPKVDVAALMREAEAAKTKGDVAGARGKYLAVLAAEPQNRSARDALEALSKVATPATAQTKAGSEADMLLARGIGEFYKGQFEDSEVRIKDYLAFNGSKVGLSRFFLGASKLTRYYLLGAVDRKLFNDAREEFKKAKQTAGFTPPGEKYVSPKILKVYSEVTP